MRPGGSKERFSDYMLAAAFMGLLWACLVAGLAMDNGSESLGEKRPLARPPVPGIDPIETMPAKFEAFYNDHFGFRNRLIRGHNYIRYKLFKGRSFGSVLFGKDDWLFLTKSDMVADYLGHGGMTSEKLSAWYDYISQRQARLAQHGIKYLFVMAPNKATIYPEKLPDHIGRRPGRTRMDLLVEYLAGQPAVNFLDPRQDLRGGKAMGAVYYRNDTHWNDRGAFLAYRTIRERLSPWFDNIRPRSLEDFVLREATWEGDLSAMLGLKDVLTADCEFLSPRTPNRASMTSLAARHSPWPIDQPIRQVTTAQCPNRQGRLLVIHDSFGLAGSFRQLLAEHFARSIFVYGHLNDRNLEIVIDLEKPDVVIEQVVERKLKDMPDWNMEEE